MLTQYTTDIFREITQCNNPHMSSLKTYECRCSHVPTTEALVIILKSYILAD